MEAERGTKGTMRELIRYPCSRFLFTVSFNFMFLGGMGWGFDCFLPREITGRKRSPPKFLFISHNFVSLGCRGNHKVDCRVCC